MKGNYYWLKTKVWKYPGFAGWYFVSVGKRTSEEIKERYGKPRRGWGSIPVTVTVGESTWKTSIFPSKEGLYLLALKAAVRKREGIKNGDMITFSFAIQRV